MMRFIPLFLLFLLLVFVPSARADGEVPKTSLKFADVIGAWGSGADACVRKNRFLFVSETVINESEVGCFVSGNGITPDGWLLVIGKDCIAEGHQLPDFQFYFRQTRQGQLEYTSSMGVHFIQVINKCPTSESDVDL
jgi:hypothetical protein